MQNAFKAERFVPITLSDHAPVADEVMQHFRGRGFEVAGEPSITRGWRVSLHKGGLFKAVVGLKTALNIEMEPVAGGTQITAGIGIFGQQFVPSLITAFVFWPVLLAQISGMVQNAKLDDEAIRVAEAALQRHGVAVPAGSTSAAAATIGARFCVECGTRLTERAKFCGECGTKQ